jgi:superfamily II DNA or RNA helicase
MDYLHRYDNTKMATLWPHQREAVKFAADPDKPDSLISMFCGTGKSLVIRTLLATLACPLSVVVFPSLALIRQFSTSYVLHDKSELKSLDLINISSECLKDIESTTDLNKIMTFLTDNNGNAKLVMVTYQSFDVLMDAVLQCDQRIDVILYDEAHHVTSPKTQELVFNLGKELSNKRVYLTATPTNSNGIKMRPGDDDNDGDATAMCGPMFEYNYLQALDDDRLKEFEVRADLYTDNSNKCIYEAIARAILTTHNTRVMTFHSGVNGESNTDVRNFVKLEEFQRIFCDVQRKEFPEQANWQPKITFEGLDGKTKAKVREDLLTAFDATSDDNIFIMSSCETIGEGVDTKKANMCVFADPKTSSIKIRQNIGRIVRKVDGNDTRGTVLIPCWIDRRRYEECEDKAAKDAMIREQMKAGNRGDFAPILNVLAALKQESYELFEACLNYPNPVTREEKEASLDKQGFHIEAQCDDDEEEDEEDEEDNMDTDNETESNTYTPDEIQQIIDDGEQHVEVHTNDTITQHNEEAEGDVLRVYHDEDDDVYNVIRPNDNATDHQRPLTQPKKRVPLTWHADADIEMLWDIKDGLTGAMCSVVLECEVQMEDSLERHMAKAHSVKSFHDKTGKWPPSSTVLGVWFRNRRQDVNYQKKNATAPWVKYLDQHCPLWNMDQQSIKMARAEAVKSFKDQTGRLPVYHKPSKCGNINQLENSLALFLKGQRNCTHKAKHIAFLNTHCAGWNLSKNDILLTKAKSVQIFYKKYGTFPSRYSKNVQEHKLGDFLAHCKKCKDSAPHIVYLNHNCPGWNITRDDKHIMQVNALQTFKASNNRWPVPSAKDLSEKTLGIWLNCRRHEKQTNKLDEDVESLLNELCEGWNLRRLDNDMTNASAVKIFQETHKRFPEKNAFDAEESRLSTWLAMQRRNCTRTKQVLPHITFLQQNCPGWKTSVASQQLLQAKAVELFKAVNNRWPSKYSETKEEKLLGQWLSRNIFIKAHGKYLVHHKYMDDKCPGWDDTRVKKTRAPKPPPSPEEIVKAYLDKQAKNQAKAAKKKGYVATNPDVKDDINGRIADHVKPHAAADAKYVFLDHDDFKTAHALLAAGVLPSQMIIPQYDAATADKMEKHELLGSRVERGTLQATLQRLIDQKATVALLYADLTQAWSTGLEVLQLASQLQFAPHAVIGLTISLRNPDGVEYRYADVAALGIQMLKRWPQQRNLLLDKIKDGQDIPFVYGEGAPMCISLVQID